MTTTKIDTRKLDMIFFMAFETNTNLTYEQIENLALFEKGERKIMNKDKRIT